MENGSSPKSSIDLMIGTVQIKTSEINSWENCMSIFAFSNQRMLHIFYTWQFNQQIIATDFDFLELI